ncbi:MAG: autotransporter-associated beta strand repeat-containing protein [Opitutales bacterium]|jgi:fibronectin-binding autotransporter adhesin
MKSIPSDSRQASSTFSKALLAIAAVVAIAAVPAAYAGAPVYLGGNIDVGADWSTTQVPTSSDAATFTTTGGAGNLTSPVSFGEIVVNGAPALTLGNGAGTNAITLGNSTGGTGIDMSAATAGVTISAPLVLAFSQIWNVASGQTLTTSGGISGTGLSLTFTGAGTVALNSANTFTGGATVSSGTVSFNSASSFGGAGTITLNGGTLSNSISTAASVANPISVTSTSALTETVSSVSYSGAMTIGSSTILNVTIPGTDTLTITGSGAVSGSGEIELGTSTGTFRFVGSNTGSTSTTFDLGTSSATLQTRNGGTVALGALEGGASTKLIGAGSTASLNTYDIGANNQSTTFAGVISEHATNEVVSLVKVGTGTLTLTGLSTYISEGNTGLTIDAGTVAVNTLLNGGTASSIGASSAAPANVTINGGTLQYIGTAPGGNSTNRLFTIGTANATLDASGTGALDFTNTSAIVLAANVTAPQDYSLTLTGCDTNTNTLTPILGDQNTGGGNLTSLIKNGAGEWVLAGANTYSGGTSINSGTLAVSGTGTLGAGSVVLNTGTLDITAVTASSFVLTASQNLSGTGTVNASGKTLVENGQLFLSAGSPSTITVSAGGFTLGSTATSNFAVNSGASFNQLAMGSGALTYGGTLDINFGSALTSGSYGLFTFATESGDFNSVNISGSYTGSLSDSGGVWTGSISGTNFNFTDSTGALVLSTVPEPAVYGVVLGGVALLMGLRRRRLA